MKMAKIIGSLVLLVMFWASCHLTGSVLLFLDIKSMIIVGGLLVGGVLFSSGVAIPVAALGKSFGSPTETSTAEYRQYLAFYNSASRLSIGAGVLGFIIGIVCVLAALNDPSKIGANLAVALLTVFYGIILSEFVIQPLKQALISNCADIAAGE